MGGGFLFSLNFNGRKISASGIIVGQSGTDDVDVQIEGHKVLPDGIYSVPASKGEAVKAVLKSDKQRNQKTTRSKKANKDKLSFARGKDSLKSGAKDITVDAGITTPGSDGTIEIKRTSPGVTAIDPTTGKQVTLDTQKSADAFVANGGDISNVPDEFVINAIVSNLTRTSDTENRRYSAIKKGSGINDMVLIRDNNTGARFGFKYQYGFSEWYQTGAGNEEFYIARRNDTEVPPYDYYREAFNEVFVEKFNEMLGAEPMPMRIVSPTEPPAHRTKEIPGVDQSKVRGPKNGKGISLITELAHNRWDGISDAYMLEPVDADNTPTVDMKSYARMRLIDLLIGNIDRHSGNFVLADRSDGKKEIVPIDHSLSFTPSNSARIIGDGFKDSEVPRSLQSLDEYIAESDSDVWEEFMDVVGDLLQDLRGVDIDKLSSFYDDLVELVSSLSPGLLTDELKNLERDDVLNTLIGRINFMLNKMQPIHVARLLNRESRIRGLHKPE